MVVVVGIDSYMTSDLALPVLQY